MWQINKEENGIFINILFLCYQKLRISLSEQIDIYSIISIIGTKMYLIAPWLLLCHEDELVSNIKQGTILCLATQLITLFSWMIIIYCASQYRPHYSADMIIMDQGQLTVKGNIRFQNLLPSTSLDPL